MPERPEWDGFSVEELRWLEVEYCLPEKREGMFRAAGPRAIDRCGYWLGRMIDEAVTLNAKRPAGKRRKPPLLKLLHDDPGFVSDITGGRFPPENIKKHHWEGVVTIFYRLALGREAAESEGGKDSERARLVGRMAELLFVPQGQAQEPPYFRTSSVDDPTPRNLAEARVQVMQLAVQARAGRLTASIDMASGGPTFPVVARKKPGLTELGAALMAAVAAGVRLRLFFPDPKAAGPTDAEWSAGTFMKEVVRCVATGVYSNALITVWGSKKVADAERKTIVDRLDGGLTCVPVNPDVPIAPAPVGGADALESDGGPGIWAAAFLTPGCRFTCISRSPDDETEPTARLFIVPTRRMDVGTSATTAATADRLGVRPSTRASVVNLAPSSAMQLDENVANLYGRWAAAVTKAFSGAAQTYRQADV